MASMIPILKDILPMVSPCTVEVTRSDQLDEGTGQTEGMTRKGAIIGKSDKLCALDTIVYASSGHGAIVTNSTPSVLPPTSSVSSTLPTADTHPEAPGITRHQLSPGDFALIPAWTEHQEVNESDEDVVWIITRSGSTPAVVNLEGWGGKTISDS